VNEAAAAGFAADTARRLHLPQPPLLSALHDILAGAAAASTARSSSGSGSSGSSGSSSSAAAPDQPQLHAHAPAAADNSAATAITREQQPLR
jgi:sugar (pentulose or hexulose) kinase